MNLLRIYCFLSLLALACSLGLSSDLQLSDNVSGQDDLERVVALFMNQAVMEPQNYEDLNQRIRAQLFLGEDAPVDIVVSAMQKHSDKAIDSHLSNIELAYTASGYLRVIRYLDKRLGRLISRPKPDEPYRGIPLKAGSQGEDSIAAAIDLIALNKPAEENTVNKQLHIRINDWQKSFSASRRIFAVWFIQSTSHFSTEERALLLQEIEAGEIYSQEEIDGLSASLLLLD